MYILAYIDLISKHFEKVASLLCLIFLLFESLQCANAYLHLQMISQRFFYSESPTMQCLVSSYHAVGLWPSTFTVIDWCWMK